MKERQTKMFEKIDEKEAVILAAMIEKNGVFFYNLLAAKSKEKEVHDIFKKLASDEANHLKILEKVYFPEAGLNDQITDEEIMIEENISHIGAADLFTKRVDMKKLVDIVGDDPKKALMVALEMERKSYEYFFSLQKHTVDEHARKIYSDLAEEEQDHIRQINKLLEQESVFA